VRLIEAIPSVFASLRFACLFSSSSFRFFVFLFPSCPGLHTFLFHFSLFLTLGQEVGFLILIIGQERKAFVRTWVGFFHPLNGFSFSKHLLS
jgi:hypothetical protein